MKTMKNALVYNASIFLLSLLFVFSANARDYTLNKSFDWSFTVSQNATISLSNYDCDLTISSSTANKVILELILDAEAEDQEDLDELAAYLTNLKFSSSSNKLRLFTTFWESRNSKGNNSTKLKLKNGSTINLSEFKIKASLMVPKSSLIDLTSKYSNITLQDVDELTLDSYDDKINGENVAGEVGIKAKYSEMEFFSLGTCNFDIYDSKLIAERAGDIDVHSKYSDINIGATGDLEIDSYDDNFKFETTGEVRMQGKYSDFNSQSSGNLTLNMYDSDFLIDETRALSISESKYSGYTFRQCGEVEISQSYDDVYKIGELPSLEVDNSKYSDYLFNNLEQHFSIHEGYDDNIKIQRTSSAFKYFDMNSKYGKVNLRIPANVPLKIDWQTKYGNLDIEETQVKTKIKIKESSEFEYIGFRGGESDSSPYIKIRGYDIKLKLVE